MIGDYAMNLHGVRRLTPIVDFWIEDTLENRQNLRKAFAELGLGDLKPIETMQFLAGWTDFRISSDLVLDLMTNLPGLEKLSFDECLSLASIGDIEGVKVPFCTSTILL